MTQELYQTAMKFAGEKHRNQQVPGTKANYLLHISNVAMEILMSYSVAKNFDVDLAVQIAILHDSIEDTDTTFEELKNNFGEDVAKGVQALTKNSALPSKQEKMKDCIDRINQLSKEVGMVKLADRITNLQKPPEHWNKEKIAYYLEEARLISDSLQHKNEYLNNRLDSKIQEYGSYLK